MDPMTWFYIASLVVSLYVSIAMRPKIQHAKPPELSEYSIPVSEEGRDVVWIHGEVWMQDPSVIGWGNLRTTPIRAEGGK